MPGLLGAHDDPSGFEPRHPVLVEVHRRHPHWRLGRTDRVFEALVPSIVEQKVTGKEAFAGFRTLVHFHGERGARSGPRAPKLWVQPSAEVLRRIPSWEWLRLHVDPARSRTIVQAARVADALDRADAPADADAKLRTLPGVGVWTSAEVRQRAFGDPTPSASATTTSPRTSAGPCSAAAIDDDELAELLEEWRPHRGRVQALRRDGRPRRPASRSADVAADPLPEPSPLVETRSSTSGAALQQRPERPEHRLGELAVQVAGLPLVEGQLEAVGLVDSEDLLQRLGQRRSR